MSDMGNREIRLIGFLCNWCSYGGADAAGVARFDQPANLRIIRMPCTGRMDPLFAVKALLGGADGVLVSGCHPRDCHYTEGNLYARRRLEVFKRFLSVTGIHPDRFEYTWVSASEASRWQLVVQEFTQRIMALGPMPSLDPELLVSATKLMNGSHTPLGSPLGADTPEKLSVPGNDPEGGPR